MSAASPLSRRAFMAGAAATVAFALEPASAFVAAPEALRKPLDPGRADAFLALRRDGGVTLYCGKVDLGQGLRIAMRQIVAEELGLGVEAIAYVEGDTALTPDQGRTSGSNGVQRGGVQLRRAAATLRAALLRRAAERLTLPAEILDLRDGAVVAPTGAGLALVDLLDGPPLDLKLDPAAPLRAPSTYRLVGRPLPRPDMPAKCVGAHRYVHDVAVEGMLHARVLRAPALGAELLSVDEGSVAAIPGARVVRVKNFLAVVAADEWSAIRAARALKARWSEAASLPDQSRLAETLRATGLPEGERIVAKGAAQGREAAKSLKASYFWPAQSHASLGPSCAVADVRADGATIWTASQGTHGNRASFARFLKLPPEAVRLIYVDGAGCYGMNGHEDAAADAAIVSRAVGRPVRLQWSRADELGFDPKGPPQLIDVAARLDAQGALIDWRTDLWIPENTKGLTDIPLLGPIEAGLDEGRGMNSGLLPGNADPPYRAGAIEVYAHWLKRTPLRPAPLRGPGKPGNSFAVESFTDELARAAGADPVAYRLAALADPRGRAVLERLAAMMASAQSGAGGEGRGRGVSYVHYKNNETYVAMGVALTVRRETGDIAVEQVWCAHDCGQIVNPDGVRAQVEGCIVQTLSRTLLEEVTFDRARVTSTDFARYPILRFPQVPRIEIALIDRPEAPPLGAGEAACSCVPGAVGNAVADAVGVRLRTVPFTPARLRAALAGTG